MSIKPSFEPVQLYDQALNSTEPLRIFLQQKISIVRAIEDSHGGGYIALKKFELFQPCEQEDQRIRIVYAISRQDYLKWSLDTFRNVTFLNTPTILEDYSMQLSDGRPESQGGQIVTIQSRHDPLTLEVYLSTRLSPDEQEYDPKFRAFHLRRAETDFNLHEAKIFPF